MIPPSVVSNNYLGAELLTRKILELMPSIAEPARAKPYFIGGLASDYASQQRIEAFGSTVLELCGTLGDDQFITCGYSPGSAAREIAALCDRLGGADPSTDRAPICAARSRGHRGRGQPRPPQRPDP